MKKYLLLIGLILCSGIATTQTFQRTNKAPAFFMPADAMNKPQPRQQRRVLPSQQQPQQIRQQPKQQAATSAQKIQSPTTTPKTSTANQTNPPVKTKPTVTAAQPKPKLKPQQKIAVKKPTPTHQSANPPKSSKNELAATKPIKTTPQKNIADQPTQPTQPKNVFEQIMADYEHDIKLIGQKQKVRNLRLQKVLSSFQDKDIPF